MRYESGFAKEFKSVITKIDPALRAKVETGITADKLFSLIQQPVINSIDEFEPIHDVKDYDSKLLQYAGTGQELLRNGEVATCLLGAGAPVKTAIPTDPIMPVPGIGMSLLGTKLVQTAVTPQTWIIVDPRHLERIKSDMIGIVISDRDNIQLIPQGQTYALNPLHVPILDGNGMPETLPTGTGDVPATLGREGILQKFVEGGGRYIIFMNMNNIAARPIAEIVGYHAASGNDVTCQVVDRMKKDTGGTPMYANGGPCVVEDSCIPYANDVKKSLLNTNTFIVNAELLLQEHQVPWRYSRETVNINGKVMVTYRRKITQLFEHAENVEFIRMPRETFLPLRSRQDIPIIKKFVEKHRLSPL